MSTDTGETKTPEDEASLSECMGRWKHTWKWVWKGNEWTDRQVCGTCGHTRDGDRDKS